MRHVYQTVTYRVKGVMFCLYGRNLNNGHHSDMIHRNFQRLVRFQFRLSFQGVKL